MHNYLALIKSLWLAICQIFNNQMNYDKDEVFWRK